jgi:hypothetical protein
MKKIFIIAIASIAMFGCSKQPKNDAVSSVDKAGSIETQLSVEKLLDGRFIYTTQNRVWKDGSLVNTFIHVDTVPSLGVPEKLSALPREYSLFVTVK